MDYSNVIRKLILFRMDKSYFFTRFKEIEETDGWEKLFYKLCIDSESQIRKLSLSCDVSMSDENFEKNRYRNVLPYDENRVILKSNNASDSYINASPLNITLNERNYILTQGPLQNTMDNFWQMVYEQKSSIIVMLSKIFENGQFKCQPYFPSGSQKLVKSEFFTCELLEEISKVNYVIRRIRISPSQEFVTPTLIDSNDLSVTQDRIVYHYQYLKWPDFDVPETTDEFLAFLFEIRSCWSNLSAEEACQPIICHCSAGIGRTGTFIVVDTVLHMMKNDSIYNSKGIENIKTMEDLMVFLRRYRMGLIQTPQQLRYSWQAIIDGLQRNQKDETKESSKTCDETSTMLSQSISEVPTTSKNGDAGKFFPKKLTSDQQKRKEMVERMKGKMRKWDDYRNLSFLGRLTRRMRVLYDPPSNLIISATCVALVSLGVYYYFSLRNRHI